DSSSVTSYLPATAQIAYDGNGNMTTNGTRIFEYDDENQLIRITEPSAWKSEFTYDGKMRRRTRKEFTWQSAWVQTNEVRYIYDPFGNTLSSGGPLGDANLYRFSSKEVDLKSALAYYLYRSYSPSLQRWLSQDPLVDQATIRRKSRAEKVLTPARLANPYGFV